MALSIWVRRTRTCQCLWAINLALRWHFDAVLWRYCSTPQTHPNETI